MYVCMYGCVSASFIVYFCVCVLCNFHVVVFLRQLFGAPFFKTNHKHHEADDDNFQFLFACFLLLRFLLFLLHCNQCNLFLFCYCFLPQLFRGKDWRRKNAVALPSVGLTANCQSDSALSARARGLPMQFFNAYFA